MSKIKFINEFNAIMEHCRIKDIPSRERLVLISLFYIANDRSVPTIGGEREWPDGFFAVSNRELGEYTTYDKKAINVLRASLKDKGLIDYVPGLKKVRPPMYKLHYLSIGGQFGGQIGSKKAPNVTTKEEHIRGKKVTNVTTLLIDKKDIEDKRRGDTTTGYIDTDKDIGWGELL